MFRISCIANSGSTSPLTDEQFELNYIAAFKAKALFPAYTGKRVCAVVQCFRCQKPRCIYTNKPLSSQPNLSLTEVLKSTVFACGTALFFPGHPLEEKVYTKSTLRCEDNMEVAFYCSRFSSGEVCHRCGGQIEKKVTKISSNRLGLELPVCVLCKIME